MRFVFNEGSPGEWSSFSFMIPLLTPSRKVQQSRKWYPRSLSKTIGCLHPTKHCDISQAVSVLGVCVFSTHCRWSHQDTCVLLLAFQFSHRRDLIVERVFWPVQDRHSS